MKRFRLLIGAMILSLFGMVVALAIVEGVFHLAPGLLPVEVQQQVQASSRTMGVSHPYIGNLQAPNREGVIWGSDFRATHHTDAHGFRNDSPWPERAEIVVVGDSLVFGYGVEDDEAWPALLAQGMPQFRLINLGLIGASPQQYLRVYETFGAPLQPKLLIVGFFAANDFWDAGLYERWLASGVGGNYLVWRDFGRNLPTGAGAFAPIDAIRSWLLRRSYLYNFLRFARNAFQNWRQGSTRVLEYENGVKLRLSRDIWDAHMTGSQPDQRQFHLAFQALKRIQDIAQEHGTKVLVVFQPGKERVYLPLLGESFPDPTDALRKALDELGVDYLDLLPAFRREAKDGKQLFFATDGHPNRHGYRLIAAEVFAHLKRRANVYGLGDAWGRAAAPKTGSLSGRTSAHSPNP